MSAPLHLTLEGCEDEDCERHRTLGGLRMRKAIVQLVCSATIATIAPSVWGRIMLMRYGDGVSSMDQSVTAPYQYMPITMVEHPEDGRGMQADPNILLWPVDWSRTHPTLTWALQVKRSGIVRVHGDLHNLKKEFWSVAADPYTVSDFCGTAMNGTLNITNAETIYRQASSTAASTTSSLFIWRATVTASGLRHYFLLRDRAWQRVSEKEFYASFSGSREEQTLTPETWHVSIANRHATFTGDVPESSQRFWTELAKTQPTCHTPNVVVGSGAR